MGARCYWTVSAGVIPGVPVPELTKTWGIDSAEWSDLDAGGRDALIRRRKAEALDYASSLHDPSRLNWVEVRWIWM